MSSPQQPRKVYIPERKILAQYRAKATAAYWDQLWDGMDPADVARAASDPFFTPVITGYLPVGSTVLEGGCGHGHVVQALHLHGYRAIGVDFAERSLARLGEALPHLDLRVGDVRELPLPDGCLDGYVSGGVIEHFWEGYDAILGEMRRALRVGGYAFVTFPVMSPLRQLKAALCAYPTASYAELEPRREQFYQFLLDWPTVVQDFAKSGFYLQQVDFLDGVLGAVAELAWTKPFLGPIYDGKSPELRGGLDAMLDPVTAHIVRLVMRKLH